ncbi:MAG: hypothetical protein U9N34_08625, partial [Candidatus Cloacimonadota bacterium]|nr:hypothetical protein [Candidatus Cloacimonadota bacterium]
TIAAAAVTTSAFAATATVSADGKGDYLVSPAYYATADGWSTNVRVVNTNTTTAVVAKVVIREYATSKELLDFPIYLSPGDVWTADLINDGSGTVTVNSTDDSSPEVPMSPVLNDNNPLVGTAYGYIEVLAVASKAAVAIDGTWTQFEQLDKADIKADFNANGTVWDAPIQSLFGQEVITATTAGAEKSMTLGSTAFVIGDNAGAAWRTVGTDSIFATDTQLDYVYGTGTEANIRTAIDTLGVHVINYVADAGETQLLLTQVQKHVNPDADTTTVVPYYPSTAADLAERGTVSRFFYMARAWDESENTFTPDASIYSGTTTFTTANPCDTEICYIYTSDANNYAAGWVDYTLGTASNGAGNLAVPTISTVMTGVKVNGRGITNILPAAITQ